MSVRVMSAVWALDLPAGEKLLLLALADCANDDGHCWPGMRNLRAKTGKCERSIQLAIKALCGAGHLTREENPGKGCFYTVHPQATLALTPAETAPRKKYAPQKTTQTPAETAPKPLRTINKIEAKASCENELKPEHVVEAWNMTAQRYGLPQVKKLTSGRKQKLRARLRENSIEDFTEAIDAIGRSPFLRGEGPQGWKANFDFLLQPSSFTKLIEGNYDQ